MANWITKGELIKNRRGQSLVEVLIALAIGAMIMSAAVAAIGITLRTNASNTARIQGIPLAQELAEKVKSLSEGSWTSIYNLNKSAGSTYFIVQDGGLKIIPGAEGVLADDIKSGLVGYWKFDEGSGDVFYDYSGNSLTGALSSATPPLRDNSSCKIVGCLIFDGANDLATVPDSPALSAVLGSSNKIFTISAWAKPTSWVNYSTILNKATGGSWSNTTAGLWSYSGGFRCVVGSNVGGNPAGSYVGVDSKPDLNAWHNIVCSSDGTTLRIYMDGVEAASTTIAGSVNPTSNSAAMTIGRRYPGQTESFPGTIDEIRVYNRTLSSADISQLYKSTVYTRYFTVNNVDRDAFGNITNGGDEDPNVQKISVNLSWTSGSNNFDQYIERVRNAALDHTDWSNENEYDSLQGVDPDSVPGQITLQD